jgi:hypothetical protein
MLERLEQRAAENAILGEQLRAQRERLQLTERARSTLEAELAEERRRREEAELELARLRGRLAASEEPTVAERADDLPPAGPEGTLDATRTVPEAPEGSEPQPAVAEAQEGAQGTEGRSWWRRFFGL